MTAMRALLLGCPPAMSFSASSFMLSALRLARLLSVILLLPEGLRRSKCFKRRAESHKGDAETAIAGGQPKKRARMTVTAVRMDEEQPGAVLPADAGP